MNNNVTTTTNGAKAFKSTLNANLDFFFQAPAMRGQNVVPLFQRAYKEDPETAIRILQWLRDIRGGAGVRQLFIDIMTSNTIEENTTLRLINKIPEVGRFKDLVSFLNTPYEEEAFCIIAQALAQKNGLCAKWMPRQGEFANKLRKFLGIKTPKEYRKLLVDLSDTVEQKISAGEWDQIAFDKLPSLAAKRYQSLFNKYAAVAYAEYKKKLEEGEAKVNASTLYPHECIVSLRHGDATISQAQWDALPDYLNGSDRRILPLVDVSGSMDARAGGHNSRSTVTVTCMDVAIALGLYISERNTGPFHNKFITFHESPSFFEVSGSLSERVRQARRAPWGGSTNLEKVFEILLDSALTHKISQEEMPTDILVLSDMQFDFAFRRPSISLFERITELYEQSGYKRPKIVFWNINSSGNNVPITAGIADTGLVSGFSPSVIKGVLSGEIDPIGIMMSIISNERYNL